MSNYVICAIINIRVVVWHTLAKAKEGKNMGNVEQYIGLTFTDIHNKKITLDKTGIVVSREKGIWHKFNRTIPYSAVRGIHDNPATVLTAGFFSILTSVGGITYQNPVPTMAQAGELAEDENTFSYRKKHSKKIAEIIYAIDVMKENAAIMPSDPFEEFWGICFIDIFKRKVEVTPSGLQISKGDFSKVIKYSDILDLHIKEPQKKLDGGVLTIVENAGLSAVKKLEQLDQLSAAKLYNDENSFHFAKSSYGEIEKVYYAIKTLMNSRQWIGSETLASADDDTAVELFAMDGHKFEYFCAEILKNNGFVNVSVTKGSGDQGVDVLAIKDGIKYAIQCKNYSTPLGNTPVQEVNAGKTYYNCHVGVVMTNSTFTQGAKALAQATGVLLWDGNILQSMAMPKDE